MFVISVKTTSKRVGSALLCALLSVAVLVVALVAPSPSTATAVAAETQEQQLCFLRSLGYEAEEIPLSVEEIALLDEPDDTTKAYHKLQTEGGFDWTEYAGKRVKCWSYAVQSDSTGAATAHLYVYDGTLIGGDVSSKNGKSIRALTPIKQED